MKMPDLEEVTGLPARTIRHLISEEIVPKPGGSATKPIYGEGHVAAAARYTALSSLGMKVPEIREFLKLQAYVNSRIPVPIAPGLTLTVDPGFDPRTAEPKRVGDAVRAFVTALIAERQEKTDAA